MAIKGGKLTPYLLNRGDEMCPRRLAREFRSEDGTKDFFSRWRVRDTLLAALEDAHVESCAPIADHLNFSPGADELRSEEALVLVGAAIGYCEFFRDRPAATITYETADTASIKLGGAIDLVVTVQAGVELRQLELWRRPVCASPFDSWELGLAVYRLANWLDTETLHVVHLDPLSGAVDEYDFRPTDFDELRQRLNQRTRTLIDRMRREDQPEPGGGCVDCAYVPNCPAVDRVT
jgi:hypothetical protein